MERCGLVLHEIATIENSPERRTPRVWQVSKKLSQVGVFDSVLHSLGDPCLARVVLKEGQSHNGFVGMEEPATQDKTCPPLADVREHHALEKTKEFPVLRRKRNRREPVFD